MGTKHGITHDSSRRCSVEMNSGACNDHSTHERVRVVSANFWV